MKTVCPWHTDEGQALAIQLGIQQLALLCKQHNNQSFTKDWAHSKTESACSLSVEVRAL